MNLSKRNFVPRRKVEWDDHYSVGDHVAINQPKKVMSYKSSIHAAEFEIETTRTEGKAYGVCFTFLVYRLQFLDTTRLGSCFIQTM
jgi:hypothetical protein